MTVGKNVTYCLVKQVENFLPQLGTLSETTTPKKSQVEQYIQQAEGELDRRTLHAWRERHFTMEYDLSSEDFNTQRTHGYSLWFDGVIIRLQHFGVKELDATKGDELTVRQGSNRVDYLATKTEGLNQDYFITPQRGLLHLYRRWVIQLLDKVRVTYRYGSGTQSDVASSSTGTITVDDASLFQPGTVFLAQDSGGVVSYEVAYVNSRSGTVLNVARAQQGTSQLTLAADDLCWQVPDEVQKAAVRLAAIEIAHNDGLTINENLGDGRDYEGIETRIRVWREEVDRLIETLVGMVRV